ncbi:glycosyltransferase family 9 protein [Basfia succiniciproducens]|uniref:glycosyltransferase family 9 protein n=1 Tax=Basfia succiniciproducens TaxID=653940 RepID=UPI003FCCCA70
MKQLIAKIVSCRTPKESINLSKIRSILLKPIGDAIGDTIVHIAHIAQIKQAFPHIKIGVLTTYRNKELFLLSSMIDVVLDNKFSTFLLQRKKWDIYLDFQPTFTSKSLIFDYLLAPKYVINFGKKYKKIYNLDNIKNYDFSTVLPENTHISDYLNYSVLRNYLEKNYIDYHVNIDPERKKVISNCWKPHKVRILLNPQGSMREISSDELINLLELINPLFIEKISFLLVNVKDSDSYLSKLPTKFNIQLAPSTDITEYIALMDSADIVVAVDGGGVHIACACGKPLLAFYANHSQNINRWHPKPKIGVDTYMVISNRKTDDNNDTKGFAMEKPAEWLDKQIKKYI